MHIYFSLKSISIRYWSLNLKWLFFNVSKIDPYFNEPSIDIYEISCFMFSDFCNIAEPTESLLGPSLLHLIHVISKLKINLWGFRLLCMEVSLGPKRTSAPFIPAAQ